MKLELSPKQKQMLELVMSQKYKFLLYGGGVGGGKTYLMALLFIGLACDLKNTRYAIIRKNLTTLRRTTFRTFLKFLEDNSIPHTLNRVDLIITFQNGSTIEFIEADESKDPDFNKLKGLEVTAVGIDEANEISEQAFNVLITRVGRWNNTLLDPFIFLTCNPSQTWVRTKFYDKWSTDELKAPYYYLPALPTDNPFLSKEYLDQLQYLPETEYNRYVLGNWDYGDDPNQLIKYEWIKANIIQPFDAGFDTLGVDVAREGNDRSVIAYTRENELGKVEVVNTQDTTVLADTIFNRYVECNTNPEIKVDAVGVGGGVVDYVRRRGIKVTEYKSGFSVDYRQNDFMRYKNQRAKDYWGLREGLREGKLKIIENSDLIKELINVKYIVTDKVIQIEEKREIKKRLGYSPDVADAVVIAFSELRKPFEVKVYPQGILG